MANKEFLFFLAGVGVGAATAVYFLKEKYEKKAQEEIDSVKETFYRINNIKTSAPNETPGDTDRNHQPDMTDMKTYASLIKDRQYTDYSASKSELEDSLLRKNQVYIISPDEFGDLTEYDTISLTYYADGVLTDFQDNEVEDVDATVGSESLNHFGEYEEDVVYVRNDRLKVDYEILKDNRKFIEVTGEDPGSPGEGE